ncbi:hypothetical protein IEQ34_012164 [Dendrobium chrysotoxum]|uniref:CREG-like beta-barrel domain-containing protein n=1 Tax=Dendrobium chrysotoxum TaxID=161865 RepID=A0AAV7GVS9_DENCH|nr:hypothetical protein IEQ34_012164 [Dendrobium chrysotoxum]
MKSLIRLTPSVVPSPSFSGSINGIFNVPLSTLFTSYLRPFCRSRRPLSFHPLTMASSASQSSLTAAPVDGVSDVFQLIQAHQASAPRLPPLEEVRTILDNSIRGMLSTFSKEHEGYPSGSMVDFACDHDGSPLLAVSRLAVHSKNLLENPKCSLLVAKDPEDRTDIVITLFGDAVLVSEDDKEAVRAAYLRRHPNAFWVDFGDFCFIQIRPKFVHFVSGVATALLGSGDFNAEEFRAAKVDPISQFSVPISSHMNKDHSEDTKAIAGHQGGTYKLRIPFPRRAQDRKDVKTLIIEMLQAARAPPILFEIIFFFFLLYKIVFKYKIFLKY